MTKDVEEGLSSLFRLFGLSGRLVCSVYLVHLVDLGNLLFSVWAASTD